ncbi:hypothetical protein HA402_000812 [Bradysia odoriphaga]|nr:hypothetical protein HA402_000812 [Bradysia odoriphaga]
MLAAPEKATDPIFEVIAPSLPGFAWSEGSSKTGFGVAEMAVVLRNLMIRLGYKRFYIQGGDWGSILGSTIAQLFPENVIGYHSNMCVVNSPLALIKGVVASFYPPYFVEKEHEDFFFPLTEKLENLVMESGYFHLQSTKPDTIGIALTNNPIGMAAYILEKFATWTYPHNKSLPHGGLDNRKDLYDAYLDNIMIYYLTNSITTSMRLYAESFTQQHLAYNLERVPTDVPVGCARFKNDIAHSFDWQLTDKYRNLIHSTYYEKGGHFIALEAPEVLYNDIVEFVRKVEKFTKTTK